MGLEQSKAEEELTEKEIELIRSSWKVVMQNPEENGVVLFKTFLYKYKYFSLFPKFEGIPLDKLPEEKVFRNHSLAIVKAIDRVISNLENKTKLKEGLNSIVESHKNRNVTERQFEELKGIILDSLSEVFKLPEDSMAAFTKALEIAFADVVNALRT